MNVDPNANLTELRALIEANIDREYVSDHDTARIIELVDALDGWLSGKGFLPAAWAGPVRHGA